MKTIHFFLITIIITTSFNLTATSKISDFYSENKQKKEKKNKDDVEKISNVAFSVQEASMFGYVLVDSIRGELNRKNNYKKTRKITASRGGDSFWVDYNSDITTIKQRTIPTTSGIREVGGEHDINRYTESYQNYETSEKKKRTYKIYIFKKQE